MPCLNLGRREHIANIRSPLPKSWALKNVVRFMKNRRAARHGAKHALQLLCAIAMEPPINAHADAIRDESSKCCAPSNLDTRNLEQHVCAASTVQQAHGQAVAGYNEETGVHPNSSTETFVALRTEIANWRWAGVPFYIRTGKRLPQEGIH